MGAFHSRSCVGRPIAPARNGVLPLAHGLANDSKRVKMARLHAHMRDGRSAGFWNPRARYGPYMIRTSGLHCDGAVPVYKLVGH